MIYIVTGKPGGGKGLYGVKQTCEELRSSARIIVTNLGWYMDRLSAWYAEQKNEVPLSSRFVLLDESQVRDFYLWGPSGRIEADMVLRPACGKVSAVMIPDSTIYTREPGWLAIIDEAHLYFAARDWQDNPLSATASWFFSQHRHLRWDVILITQHPELIDKNLRRWCQEYVVCRNLRKERFVLGVRGLKSMQFRRATYLEIPSSLTPAMEVGYFKLDKVEADLYDTSAGVGLSGRVDTKEAEKGRHPAWLLVAGCGIVVATLVALWGSAKVINVGIGAFFRGAAKQVSSLTGGAQAAAGQVSVAGQSLATVRPVRAVEPVSSVPIVGTVDGGGHHGVRFALHHEGDVTLRGACLCAFGGVVCYEWVLSDGTIIRPSTDGFERGSVDSVTVNGQTFVRVASEPMPQPMSSPEDSAVLVNVHRQSESRNRAESQIMRGQHAGIQKTEPLPAEPTTGD